MSFFSLCCRQRRPSRSHLAPRLCALVAGGLGWGSALSMEFIDFEAEDEDDDVAGSHGGYDEHQQYGDVDAEVCVVRARGPSAMHARFNNRLEMERDDAEIERLAQRYAPQRHAPQRHLPPPQRHLPPPRAPPRHAAPASGSAKLPTQASGSANLPTQARAGAPSCRATASRAPPSSSAAAAPRVPHSNHTVKDRMQASFFSLSLSHGAFLPPYAARRPAPTYVGLPPPHRVFSFFPQFPNKQSIFGSTLSDLPRRGGMKCQTQSHTQVRGLVSRGEDARGRGTSCARAASSSDSAFGRARSVGGAFGSGTAPDSAFGRGRAGSSSDSAFGRGRYVGGGSSLGRASSAGGAFGSGSAAAFGRESAGGGVSSRGGSVSSRGGSVSSRAGLVSSRGGSTADSSDTRQLFNGDGAFGRGRPPRHQSAASDRRGPPTSDWETAFGNVPALNVRAARPEELRRGAGESPPLSSQSGQGLRRNLPLSSQSGQGVRRNHATPTWASVISEEGVGGSTTATRGGATTATRGGSTTATRGGATTATRIPMAFTLAQRAQAALAPNEPHAQWPESQQGEWPECQ